MIRYRHEQLDHFEQALWMFDLQYEHSPVYRRYVDLLGMADRTFRKVSEIPHLPISAYKYHDVMTGSWQPEVTYTSSGTGGSQSRHLVRDNRAYLDNCRRGFEQFYGKLSDYAILALLPSYLERAGSSLITMMQDFIDASGNQQSDFFLHDHDRLLDTLAACRAKGQPTILWGVTYALLDLGEQYRIEDWPDLIVVETGGMKGTRPEMIKADLHDTLSQQYGVPAIHSEYGMTELLSQAYSLGGGVFYPSKTMQVHCRDITDPLAIAPMGKTGVLHIYDSKNVNSCAFVATSDLGRMRPDGGFEIMGRLDMAEARGCNLLLQEII